MFLLHEIPKQWASLGTMGTMQCEINILVKVFGYLSTGCYLHHANKFTFYSYKLMIQAHFKLF